MELKHKRILTHPEAQEPGTMEKILRELDEEKGLSIVSINTTATNKHVVIDIFYTSES